MEKLIGMREFVLEQSKIKQSTSEFKETILNYANFLSQPLTLNMFIPCSEEGVVFEYNKTTQEIFSDDNNICRVISKEESAYLKALEKVLFYGFEVCKRNSKLDCIFNSELDLHYSLSWMEKETIEDLTKYNLTLTQSAINQLKL